MDTDQTSVPGEEFLDLPLERPSDGELDLDGSFLDLEEDEPGVVPSLDGVVAEGEDPTPPPDGLLELTDDVWGPDGGETADPVAAPEIDEELEAGLAIEPATEDDDEEPIFGLAAAGEAPSIRHAGRRKAGEVWAGMAPSRRRAVGVGVSAFVAVALGGAAWVQRPDGSESVISTGAVQTTSSVPRRTTPAPTSTALRATDTSAPADTAASPASNEPGTTSPPPVVPGGPPPARAGGAPAASASAPATTAPARGGTTPATRAAETPAAPEATTPPATTAPPANTAPPATTAPPETTETTRRSREIPTTVTTEVPTPPTAPTTETTLQCSVFVKRGPLACPPEE